MQYGTWFAIYFIIWWLTLFMVLPFAARSKAQDAPVAGADPGAPPKPNFVKILTTTSLVAAAIFAGVMWLIESGALG